jgi:hypothetical protein
MLSLAVETTGLATLAEGSVVLAVGGGFAPSSLVNRLDARARTWVASVPLPVPRADHQVVTLKDGRVLAVGGYSGDIIANVDVYEFAR